MALTTEGLIEEISRFRSDKLALVGLVACMGAESPEDALVRLREVIAISGEQLTKIRGLPVAERRKRGASEKLWKDVRGLATEIEPWLSQIAPVLPDT